MKTTLIILVKFSHRIHRGVHHNRRTWWCKGRQPSYRNLFRRGTETSKPHRHCETMVFRKIRKYMDSLVSVAYMKEKHMPCSNFGMFLPIEKTAPRKKRHPRLSDVDPYRPNSWTLKIKQNLISRRCTKNKQRNVQVWIIYINEKDVECANQPVQFSVHIFGLLGLFGVNWSQYQPLHVFI